jgi:glycosyltransferase involved in cell wall biosynthesis
LLDQLPSERRRDLHFIPLVTPGELPRKLTEFDIGLALEQHSPRNRDLTITNKILQYLNAGLAVVATDTTGQQEVMRAAPESGLSLQESATARNAELLDSLIGDRDRLRRCQLAARQAAASEFCWEKDTPRLLAAVERAVATAAPTVR